MIGEFVSKEGNSIEFDKSIQFSNELREGSITIMSPEGSVVRSENEH